MDDSFHESFTCKDDKVHEEPGDLLEKSWFFGNFLDTRKTRIMSRCYSDACPTSNYIEEMVVGKSYEETYSSIEKLPQGDHNLKRPAGLVRTPSLPEDSTHHEAKGRRNHLHRAEKSILETPPRNYLLRAPSLPSSLGREEIQDEESDFSMSRLIRQASLKHSEVLPPRHEPKGPVAQSLSTQRQRQRRKPELESILKESSSAPEGIRKQQQPISRTKLAKSSSDVVLQELQGLGELSIKIDKSDQLDPNINIAKTFQSGEREKKQSGKNEDCKQMIRKLSRSSSEPWEEQRSSSPQIGDWAGKRSAEDMKAQIKFWARAVASNVRQEC